MKRLTILIAVAMLSNLAIMYGQDTVGIVQSGSFVITADSDALKSYLLYHAPGANLSSMSIQQYNGGEYYLVGEGDVMIGVPLTLTSGIFNTNENEATNICTGAPCSGCAFVTTGSGEIIGCTCILLPGGGGSGSCNHTLIGETKAYIESDWLN